MEFILVINFFIILTLVLSDTTSVIASFYTNNNYNNNNGYNNQRGPIFINEPSNVVEFLNDTGVTIGCSASGNPEPQVTWLNKDGIPVNNIPGLRYVGQDGTLVFPPFHSELYSPEIHSTVYKCQASNPIGTIVSRESNIRAVLKYSFSPEVYDEYVISKNVGLLKCVVPSYVRDFVTVIQWIREPSLLIDYTDYIVEGSKYKFLTSGELVVNNVGAFDSDFKYKCKTKHKLNGEVYTSKSTGKFIITEAYNSIPPRITYVSPRTIAEKGSSVLIACIAQGFPSVNYFWTKNGRPLLESHNRYVSSRVTIVDNGFLSFDSVQLNDTGSYQCFVNNSEGSDIRKVEIIVKTPLKVSILPSFITSKSGEKLRINCTIAGYPINSITWLKDGYTLDTSLSRYEPIGNVLNINKVRKEDAGIYQCMVRNDFETVQASATLYFDEEPPKFLEFFTSKDMMPGESLSLKCMATGNPLPQITWTLDENSLDHIRNVRIGDYVTSDNNVISFVNITSVEVENSGHYTCTASNDFDSIQNSGHIKVFGPPHVRQMNNLTSIEKKTINIRCPVGGHPIADLFWEKDGKRLPMNHKQSINSNNGSLTLKEISKEMDEGFYSCTARNSDGHSSTNGFHLSIKVAPKIEPFLLSNNVNLGQRLSITCTVIKGDPPIVIKWLKNGELIKEDDSLPAEMTIHHLADYSSTFLFKSIKSDHKGNYTCSASNDVGQDSYSTNLIVYAPPYWTHEPVDMSVKKGSQLWVNCQSSGFPQPRIVWKKAQNSSSTSSYKTIISSFHIQILDNGTLFVDDVQKSDSGNYLCQASNGIGFDLSKIIQVSVHEAAHFKSKFRAETHRRDEDLSLTCEAFGERPMKIDWEKDNKRLILDQRVYLKDTTTLDGMQSELIVHRLGRSDSAIYTCKAANAYGKDETRIQLIVLEPPEMPTEVKIIDVKSRKAHLSWTPPFNGNSRLTKYIVFLEEFEEFTKVVRRRWNQTVQPTESLTLITDLKPYQKYSISLAAINEIGMGVKSPLIHFETEEEVPDLVPKDIKAFPVSSKVIKVTWSGQDIRYPFGRIKGYYVGFKPWDSKEGFTYKTIAFEPKFKPEAILKNLLRKTKYEIVVQAYNTKGVGPSSASITAQTHHQDPPETPSLQKVSAGKSEITVAWSLKDTQNEITGFIIKALSYKNDVIEKSIGPTLRNYTFVNLSCGTNYDVTIRAFNIIGSSEKSSSLSIKTAGDVAIAPDKESLINHLNGTTLSINLSSWRSVECPIQYFSVKYKLDKENVWTVVSNRIESSRNLLIIDGLIPQKWYTLQTTAFTEPGTTEAEYSFLTPSLKDKEKFAVIYNDSKYRIFLELELILPLILSLLVVVAVLTLICVVMNKSQDLSIYSDAQHLNKPNSAPDLLTMSNLEKRKSSKSITGHSKEQSADYYALESSATGVTTTTLTTINSSVQCNGKFRSGSNGECHKSKLDPPPSAHDRRHPHLHLSHKYFDDIQYATVKRTPRLPKPDKNIYDCPVPVTKNYDETIETDSLRGEFGSESRNFINSM